MVVVEATARVGRGGVWAGGALSGRAMSVLPTFFLLCDAVRIPNLKMQDISGSFSSFGLEI